MNIPPSNSSIPPSLLHRAWSALEIAFRSICSVCPGRAGPASAVILSAWLLLPGSLLAQTFNEVSVTSSNYLTQFAASRTGPTRYVCAAGIYPDFRWPNNVTDYPIEIVPADRNNPPTFRAIQFGGTADRNFSHLSAAPAGSSFNNIKFDGVNFIAQRFTSAGSVSLILPDGEGLGWRIQGTSHPSAGLVGNKESGSYLGLDFNTGTNLTVTNCTFDGYAIQLGFSGNCSNVTVEYNTFRNLAEDGIKFSCDNFVGRWNLFDQSRGPTFEMSDYSGGPNPPHPDAIQQMSTVNSLTWENNVVIDRMLFGANGEMHGALIKNAQATGGSTRVIVRDNEVRTLGGTGMQLDDFTQGSAIPGTSYDVIITGNWVWTGGPTHLSPGVAIFGRFDGTSWTNARMQVTNNVAPNLWLGGAAGNTDNGDGESATPQPSSWVEKAPDRVASGVNRAGRYGWNAGVVPGSSAALLGHWRFDETSGTTAADSSGNGNNGTTSGSPTWVAGKFGNGLNFDGVDDVVNSGSGSTLDDLPAMTLAVWIKADTIGEGGFGRILQKGTGGAGGWRFLLRGTNQIEFTVDHATTDLQRVSATNAFSTGVWHHVVMTWSGSQTATDIKIYVDGVETSYATTTNGSGSRVSESAANFYIGNESGTTRTFDGVLDDVRVYDGVLGASEVLALAQATPPAISTTSLPSGRTTISYGNQQLTATGGTTPYTWSLASGTLPVGLTLNSGGIVSGTPTTAGTSNFTVRATDAVSLSDDQALSITVTTNSVPNITTTTLPGGTVGVAYSQSVNSTGGDVALGWSVQSGALPAGLTLSNVNNQNVTISGTPTTAGTANFTLQLADVDSDSDTQALSIVISDIPSAPSGLGAADVAYNQINLTWTDTSSNETGFKVERKKGASGTYDQIGTAAANATSYNDTTAGTGTNYYYRVRANNASGDSAFSNEANDTTPEVADRRGHWKLDENSGTTPQDSSGNANHGVMSPAPAWTTGNIGSALNFDGVDDIVNCSSGSTLDQLPAMTVAAWIKADTMGAGGFGRIVQKGTGGGGGWRFLLFGTNQLQLAVDYGTTDLNRISAVNALSTGVWTHVVATWTGSATATNVQLYVDGVEVSYATTTNASGTRASDAAANLYIGNESGGTRAFDGALDDVRVYNRVLSAAEITAIHRAGL